MRKILLVEDQPHIVRVMKLNLTRQGYRVDVARDGEQGLHMLRDETYDVLITDVQMPRMNGQALCEAMHQEIEGPKPFTLVVSAMTACELRDWARGLPNTEFLEKPVSLRRLAMRLDAHFAGRAPA